MSYRVATLHQFLSLLKRRSTGFASDTFLDYAGQAISGYSWGGSHRRRRLEELILSLSVPDKTAMATWRVASSATDTRTCADCGHLTPLSPQASDPGRSIFLGETDRWIGTHLRSGHVVSGGRGRVGRPVTPAGATTRTSLARASTVLFSSHFLRVEFGWCAFAA